MKPARPRARRPARRGSTGEALLAQQLQATGHEAPAREYRFHETRRWRFDFAWTSRRLAVEIEGGIWGFGRHQRAQGFSGDCEKYNAAALAGWTVLRFTTAMVQSGVALQTITETLGARS